MNKTLIFLIIITLGLISFSPSQAAACYGSMMGGGGVLIMGFLGLIYFALVTFIFSLIFWAVYKWLVKKEVMNK